MTTDPFVFGESWRIGRRCKEGLPSDESVREVCGDEYQRALSECNRIFTTGLLGECGVNKTAYIEGCVADSCKGQFTPNLPPKCVVAKAYATLCEKGYWERGDETPAFWDVKGWEEEVGCPTEEERFQPTLDTGCPQPTLEEEMRGDFKWRI